MSGRRPRRKSAKNGRPRRLSLFQLGARIHAARTCAGLTIWALSAKARVSLRTLHRLEAGRGCGAGALLRVTEALGGELVPRFGVSTERTCLAVGRVFGIEALGGRPGLSAGEAGWLAEWLSLMLAGDVWAGGAEVEARGILRQLRRLEGGGPGAVVPGELLAVLREMAGVQARGAGPRRRRADV